MVKLTERLVLARSRASDLENVRKLNCWASDLTDVSIIRKMQNVQIVSLSVNHIASLEDFSESMNLEELYIRKNDIANLAEIYYLRKLPRLRVLWLADNPCAVGDRYRMTVLKTLPNLQRLDNVPVQEDEVNEAIEQGLDLAPLAVTLKSSLKSSTKSTPESSPEQPRKSKKIKETEKKQKSSTPSTPESSPAQPRKVKKVKEVKETEDVEERDKEKEKEEDREEEKEKEKEKVLELEGGGVEKQANDTKEVKVEESVEEEIEEEIEEGGEEEIEKNTKEIEKEQRSESQTSTTEGSKESEAENGDGGEKSKESSSSSGQEGDSDEIEEGEVTLESSVKETNEIRAQLGLKPVSAEKVSQPTHSWPSRSAKARNSNLLQAVLHLVKELDADSLQIVADVVSSRLETF